MKWLKKGPFTFFDIETTGMSPIQDRIIEIGAVRIELDGKEREFSSLVNQQKNIPPEITSITGIDNLMIASAPQFSFVGEQFLEFANDSTLVAHNALFDLAFLQESLKRENLSLWKGKTIDSIKIFKKTVPNLPSYSLSFLQCHFGILIETSKRHRSLYDAKILMKIFSIVAEKINGN